MILSGQPGQGGGELGGPVPGRHEHVDDAFPGAWSPRARGPVPASPPPGARRRPRELGLRVRCRPWLDLPVPGRAPGPPTAKPARPIRPRGSDPSRTGFAQLTPGHPRAV
jgi:hypothetical protein